MIPIQGDDDVSPGFEKAGLIGASVTPDLFMNHSRAVPPRKFGGAIGRIVVDHDDLVDKRRQPREHLHDPFLFIQARDDYRYPTIFVHELDDSKLSEPCLQNPNLGPVMPTFRRWRRVA